MSISVIYTSQVPYRSALFCGGRFPHNHFNHTKCDSSGRLWAGTISLADPSMEQGCNLDGFSNGDCKCFVNIISPHLIVLILCCMIIGKATRHCDPILSNGITGNLTDDAMYYIDSFKNMVSMWKYSKEDGFIGDKESLINYNLGAVLPGRYVLGC